MDNLFSLNNKVAVITGGYGDIAMGITKAYLDAGALVVQVGRNEKKLENARRELNFPVNLFGEVADITNQEQVESLVYKIEKNHKKIDILVNAAGYQHREPSLSFKLSEWDKIIRTNLTGSFLFSKSVSEIMIKNGFGRIIMLTSLTSEIGIPGISAYAASKGGVRQYSKTLAVELAQYGVTVNCIGPGRFETSMTTKVFEDIKKKASFLKVIPMGRAGTPEDLAGISIFLASESSSYITGQSFYVDGGWLAGCGNILG